MAKKDLQAMSLTELEARKMTLQTQNAMIASAGFVIGLSYAYRTGGGLIYFVPKENEVDAVIADKQIEG